MLQCLFTQHKLANVLARQGRHDESRATHRRALTLALNSVSALQRSNADLGAGMFGDAAGAHVMLKDYRDATRILLLCSRIQPGSRPPSPLSLLYTLYMCLILLNMCLTYRQTARVHEPSQPVHDTESACRGGHGAASRSKTSWNSYQTGECGGRGCRGRVGRRSRRTRRRRAGRCNSE